MKNHMQMLYVRTRKILNLIRIRTIENDFLIRIRKVFKMLYGVG